MKARFKYFLVLSLTLSATIAAIAQPTKWQKASSWTLYNIRGVKFYKVDLDSLERYSRRPLNDDSMRSFLSQSVELPPEKAPMWMGAYVTSCIIDQKRHKIDISSYGGFFFDESNNKFYSLPQNIEKDWLNYLADCAGSLTTQ